MPEMMPSMSHSLLPDAAKFENIDLENQSDVRDSFDIVVPVIGKTGIFWIIYIK